MPSPTPIILLDGGLGTTLTTPPYSLTFTQAHPLWSTDLLLSPSGLKTLLHAQTAFAKAGADVILTDTYQASFEGFRLSGVQDEGRVGEMLRTGVRVGRESFGGERNGDGNGDGDGGRRGKVALSLGPYGATMVPGQEYSGKYDEFHNSSAQLAEWHLKRLNVFTRIPVSGDGKGEGEAVDEKERDERRQCWDDIDMIAFETIPRLDEIEAVRDVMSSIARSATAEEGKKEFWTACVFPGEGNTLPDGSSVREVVGKMLGGGGVDGGKSDNPVPMGIGFNCTKITKVEKLIGEFERAVGELVESREVGEWPALVVYPDGTNGEVYNTTTKTWEKKEKESEISWDETLYDIISRARARGLWKAIYVGGCCKTTPVEIAKLRKRIDGEVQ